MLPPGLNLGLGAIPLIGSAQTRSISAENPDGAKGGGAKAKPSYAACRDLGRGWKARAYINFGIGETVTLADIAGPGVIQHIWITCEAKVYESCVLRMYWDDDPTPSVEVPLGDFFACGHGLRAKVVSMPIAVNPDGGMNCYWPMPFRKRARITVESQATHEGVGGFFYQITYALTEVPQAAYFHAQHRRGMTTRECPEHVILDGVKGHGHYVGTYLAWAQMSNGWWGEGEIKFFIDGDRQHPTICGTGTEDYFGGAWGFYAPDEEIEQPFCTPFLGLPLSRHDAKELPRHGLYRWHIMDPIRFQQDLKVTIQALGWWPGKYQPLTDDIGSTAFWYQTLPHAPFPPLPTMNERFPR